MFISLVVPCYNEEACLPLFYREVSHILDRLAGEQPSHTGEIIFVDDGSRDGTAPVIKNLSAQDKRIRYLIFSRNFGKEAALFAGLRKASGEYVVTLDADLQDPPSLIPSMLKAVCSGEYDCVPEPAG
jgi:glycosyltransferase involved in cell wall biosynthesis